MSPEHLQVEIQRRRTSRPNYYIFSTDDDIMAEILREQGQNQPLPAKQKNSPDHPLSLAQSILGEDNVFGINEIRKTLLFLDIQTIPDVSFSEERLKLAKTLNQFLIYRTGNLTMKMMYENLKDDFAEHNHGKILYDTNWYQKESFYTAQTLRPGWYLVSWNSIPNTVSKNFLEQTESLVKFLTDNNLNNSTLQSAIDEFNSKKQAINKILISDWQLAARQLSELQINQLCRHQPVEALYDCLVIFQNIHKRYLEKIYTWTPCLSADGRLVIFGRFDARGAYVSSWKPASDHGKLGLFFSCSQ